ncbi:MAG: 3-dehydroquinate synthase [Propionibacteriaceae bacterium]|jgi:3-dehydroquinate synthase|nr:3-dehydroquinate synthase [Propionibacteriaceae bacterium]
MARWEPIDVFTDRPYQVIVGNGVCGLLPDFIGEAERVAVVFPASLTVLVANTIAPLGRPITLIDVPDAEAAKSPAVLAACWEKLAAEGFTRSDVIVGFGGGSTTDLAGFVAATWLRGVRYIAMPTTLLGIVDAAVGGKTGINLPAGKNLVGAFYEPYTVLGDLSFLRSLPQRELCSGYAEVLKAGFIADPSIIAEFAANPECALAGGELMGQLIRKAVKVKAAVVSEDFQERTSAEDNVGREALNYGHTLGHAVERCEAYSWRHGEAVAVGMVFAAEVARLLGRIDDDLADLHRQVLSAARLPTRYRGDWPTLREVMSLDKKTRGRALRMVLLDGLGQVRVEKEPDEAVLAEAFAAVGA